MTAEAVGGIAQALQQPVSGEVSQRVHTALTALQQVPPANGGEHGNTIGSVLASILGGK